MQVPSTLLLFVSLWAMGYSRDYLLTLRPSISESVLPAKTFHTLRVLNLTDIPPTKRGCRAGIKAKQQQITVIVSPGNRAQPHFCIKEKLKNNLDNLIPVKKSAIPCRSNKNLQLALVNPCSVRNKTADICEHVVSSNTDVCLFTETWLKTNDSVVRAELKPSGYGLKDCPRPSKRAGGGVGAMFKTSIKCKVVDNAELSSFEYSHMEMLFDKTKLDIHIVYRPPFSARHPVTTSTFFEEFQAYLSDCVKTQHPLLIAGDFNIHMDRANDSDKVKMDNLLSMFYLSQHVKTPTHRAGHCLDLLITRSNAELLVERVHTDYLISDHMFVHCNINIPRPPLKESSISFRRLKSIPAQELRSDLVDITSRLMLENDVHTLANEYNQGLNKVLDKHAPVMTKSFVERPRIPWFDDELRSLKRKRRKAERIWRSNQTQGNLSTLHLARDVYVVALKKKRKEHLSSLVAEASHDPRKLFRVINSICGRNQENPLPDTSSNLELANGFGKYFQEKINNIQQDIQSSDPPHIPQRDGSHSLSCFHVVTEQDVIKVVGKAKPTSCPLDPIPTTLVKDNLDILAPLLTHIINCSISSGTFPGEWKTALVTPLLKKRGADLVFKNYRPVSNLQYLSKLAERAVVNQLCAHCEASHPLPSCQSAYRAAHSTETALIKVQSDILLAMDQQKVTQLVMLDLSAAFDTVCHSTLLDIMENSYGVKNLALQWFRSYLESRSQRIIIHGSMSEMFELDKGVPQGSCLGPVLFTEYASSIFEVIHGHSMIAHGYADDHQLYDSFQPKDSQQHIRQMEVCVDSVRDWMCQMKLKLNDAKTEFILIGSPQQLSKCSCTSLTIGDCSIKATEVVCNLGAYFDRHMTMEHHIQAKCRAAYAQLATISRIREFIDDKTAEQLMHALVTSHIDYCNGLLIGVSQHLIKRLQLVQNSAARIVLKAGRRQESLPLLQQLHWLPVASRIRFKVCCLTHRAIHGWGPKYLRDMITIRDTGLRSSDAITLQVPRTRTKTGDRAFAAAAPREWNMLPVTLRNIDIYDSFKKQLKHHFFQLAYN